MSTVADALEEQVRADQETAAGESIVATGPNGRELKPTSVVQLLNKTPSFKKGLALLFDGNQETAERWVRLAINECRKTPKLLTATPESFAGALMVCAQLNLEPGPMGHAFIIPYDNTVGRGNNRRKITEATFQLGYPGIIQLGLRSGQLARFHAEEVWSEDEFDPDLMATKRVHRIPKTGDRGELIGFYGRAVLIGGVEAYFRYMTVADMVKHRDTFSKLAQQELRYAKQDQRDPHGPWFDNFAAMGRKTMIRLGRAYVPMSRDFVTAFRADEQTAVWQEGDRQARLAEDVTNDALDALAEQAERAEADEEERRAAVVTAEGAELANMAAQGQQTSPATTDGGHQGEVAPDGEKGQNAPQGAETAQPTEARGAETAQDARNGDATATEASEGRSGRRGKSGGSQQGNLLEGGSEK